MAEHRRDFIDSCVTRSSFDRIAVVASSGIGGSQMVWYGIYFESMTLQLDSRVVWEDRSDEQL